ncbi:MAG: hypothetical protein PHI55_13400 [Burkholderiaceae bacterium]|nr:hypothetical protein [Burkholderiaceae bacterium]
MYHLHRRRTVHLLCLAAALLCAGCSTLDVPRADNYAATSQKKSRALHHWDVLADDVAGRIAEKLRDWPPGEHPIYLAPASDSTFNQGFRKLLATRLLDRGITLSTQPAEIELSLDTQLVQHGSSITNGPQMPLTRLAAGVAVGRDWALYAQGAASAVASGLVLGSMLDISRLATQGSAAGGPTRTEVLVTTALASSSRYLARTADIYYIEADDALLYQVKEPPPPPPPPAPLKTWRVVSP